MAKNRHKVGGDRIRDKRGVLHKKRGAARTAETGGDHITSPRFFVLFVVKLKEKAVLI